MAFRVLMYLVSIWHDLYNNMQEHERKREDFSLPPVFPIVLYNGAKKWEAATSVKELVQKGEIFQDFLPNVRYHLVDVSQQGVDKLQGLANSIAGVFLLEKEDFENDWQEKFDTAIQWFDKEENSELWKALFHWLAYHLANKLSPKDSDNIIDEIDFENKSKQEIYTMIQTLPDRIYQDGEIQGLAKGMLKGLSWTSPHLVEKYKQQILSAKTESELEILEERIKKDIQS